jgi:hypothetical protein
LVLAVGAFASTASAPARSTATAACAHELAGLKTLSDRRRNLVYLQPHPTTIIAINRRPMPHRTPTLRSRGFERRVWRLYAQVTDYRLGRDGDIHLILFDKSDYMRAEMPAPSCLSHNARERRAILESRHLFEARCGGVTGQWRKLGAVVAIEGVGFWNRPHGQRGHSHNYAELHPVTRVQFIAGCG